MKMIHFVERNMRGAWVVCGICGIKQYYGYTKRGAIRKYREDCDVIVCQLPKSK